VFAWFDTHLESLLSPPGDIWAETLIGYHESTERNQAKTLLDAAEAQAQQTRTVDQKPFPVWVFTLDYECAPWFDPAFANAFRHRPPGRLRLWHFAHGQWLHPEQALTRAQEQVSDPIAGFLNWEPNWSPATYGDSVRRILRYLRAGDAYQVNLTFPWYARYYGSPIALYLALRAQQPVPCGAYLPLPDGGAILSRSPERFFLRLGKRLICRPMKGTAPVDAGDWLDEKTAAENVMIVDLIRNDLGRLAPPGGVHVAELFTVEPYATLKQLTSTIVAEPITAPLWTILTALFPCGSVTGAPKRRAIEIIAELESAPRGLYCGAIGVILPGGDLLVTVPIRTLLLEPNHTATLGVGSGIVIESDADAEWRECHLKTAFARQLPVRVGLIETIRWRGAQGAPLLPWHEDRVAASAAALGIPWDRDRWHQAVVQAAAANPAAEWRIRLVLNPDGTITAATTPYLPPAGRPVRFLIADSPVIDETDPLQRHKTTRRGRYDALLAQVTQEGYFDALLCNRRGELVEGCRTTLFVRFPEDPLLYTPPLESGCLAGVLRASLIASGRAAERPLSPADLKAAEAIFLGNAVHGLIPATLAR